MDEEKSLINTKKKSKAKTSNVIQTSMYLLQTNSANEAFAFMYCINPHQQLFTYTDAQPCFIQITQIEIWSDRRSKSIIYAFERCLTVCCENLNLNIQRWTLKLAYSVYEYIRRCSFNVFKASETNFTCCFKLISNFHKMLLHPLLQNVTHDTELTTILISFQPISF